uniref:DPPIV_N domain-containing protein n=1 Tax=Panagrellus redivivus TaxID=6233 RepID=A0A7E4ZX45_PANRE
MPTRWTPRLATKPHDAIINVIGSQSPTCFAPRAETTPKTRTRHRAQTDCLKRLESEGPVHIDCAHIAHGWLLQLFVKKKCHSSKMCELLPPSFQNPLKSLPTAALSPPLFSLVLPLLLFIGDPPSLQTSTSKMPSPYDGSSFSSLSLVPVLEAEHHRVFYTHDKVWLFAKKFHAQPKHHYGHHVSHKGGYSVYFDTKEKKWSEVVVYNSLLDINEEDVEEAFFLHDGHIVVLLYSHFDGITLKQLAVFDENERQFTLWEPFDENKFGLKAETTENIKQHLALADGLTKDGSKIIVANVDDTINLFKLSIDFSSKQAQLTPAGTFAPETRPWANHLFPIRAAVSNDDHVIVEVMNPLMCSPTWVPEYVERYPIASTDETPTPEKIEIEGERPPWRFIGARTTAVEKPGVWLHATGNTQKGMTGTVFNGQIWRLVDADTPKPKWEKVIFLEVPPVDQYPEVAIDATSRSLFVVDRQHGLFRTTLPE